MVYTIGRPVCLTPDAGIGETFDPPNCAVRVIPRRPGAG